MNKVLFLLLTLTYLTAVQAITCTDGYLPSIKSVRPSFIYPVAQSTYPTPHVRHVISATSEPKTENVAQPRTKLTTAVPPTAPMAVPQWPLLE